MSGLSRYMYKQIGHILKYDYRNKLEAVFLQGNILKHDIIETSNHN